MGTEQIERALNVAGMGFGVAAALAPKVFLKVYGVPESDGMHGYMTRLWGTRTAMICWLGLILQDKADRRRAAAGLAVMQAVDTVIGLTRQDVPAQARVQGAATSAFFAAAGIWLVLRDDS